MCNCVDIARCNYQKEILLFFGVENTGTSKCIKIKLKQNKHTTS